MSEYDMPPIPPLMVGDFCAQQCHDIAITGLKTGFGAGVLVTAIIFLLIIVIRLTRGVT